MSASVPFSPAAIVFAAILVFFAIAGGPAPGDAAIGRAVQDVGLGWMPANVAVFLAQPGVQFAVWCGGALAALRARNWPLLAAGFLVLIALAVNPVLKEIFARARPGADQLIIRRAADGYSFPSGHTSSATLMYGYAALSFFSARRQRAAMLFIALAAAVVTMIAFERVYDGAHWPSDVGAGFVSGYLLLAGCVSLSRILASRSRKPVLTVTDAGEDASSGGDAPAPPGSPAPRRASPHHPANRRT